MINLPNILSLLRIVLMPLCVYLLFGGSSSVLLSLLLFTIAALSDSYDGYLARRYGWTSALGAFLDPLADKVLIIGMLAGFHARGLLGLWFVLLFVGRDVAMTGLRLLFSYCGRRLETSRIAKCKTFIQFVVMYLLYVDLVAQQCAPGAYITHQLALVVPWVVGGVAALTVYSALDYIVRNRTALMEIIMQPIERIQRVIAQAHKDNKPVYYVYCDGLASLGFLGHVVPAPGTAASFVTALAVFVLHYFLPSWLIFIAMAGLFVAGLIASALVEKVHEGVDPSFIVIDEVVGMMITLMVVPHDPLWYFVAFLIFRAWDISKIFPVGLTERSFTGGMAIMMDDVVAGCCAALTIHLIRLF